MSGLPVPEKEGRHHRTYEVPGDALTGVSLLAAELEPANEKNNTGQAVGPADYACSGFNRTEKDSALPAPQ